MKEENEFENFDRTMRDLLKVPHDEIKKELDKEKTAKGQRSKRSKKEHSDEGNQNSN